MTVKQHYKVITLNVNGLHNPIKRSKAIAKMKRGKYDIIFWQETHCSDAEHEKIRKMGFKNLYYSSYSKGNSRGVAILLPSRLNFQFSSQVSDKEGRYILVKGYIDHKEVTLLNVYRPPGKDNSLIKRIFDLIATEISGVFICGGDWNICLNTSIDSSSKIKKPQAEAILVKKMLKEVGMMDVWRSLYPTNRSYTFFSHSHRVHSRLDYFFMLNADRHRIVECEIGVKDVSDHADVCLTLHLDNDRKETLWRLNTSFLKDGEFHNFVEKEIRDYTDYNNDTCTSPSIFWDALKAVLRGKLIMWSSMKKKERERRINDLTAELKSLEQKHMQNNNNDLLENIAEIKQTLNRAYEDQIEKKTKFMKQNYYENGPKAKKLLAWRLRKQQADRFIHKVKNPQDDNIHYNLKDIQNSFAAFYTQLYTQPHPLDQEATNRFLSSLDLPSIGTEQNERLNQLITEEEISRTISKLKVNKMAGEDGYPAEWYRHFRKLIIPQLKNCFNHILTGGEIPPSWKRAVISVIHKPGKDKIECGSYRPISVLNIDYRIFATILAKRLESIVPELTDTDQSGFVRNRQTHDNVRRALHLFDKMKNKESIAISLDAEKAFDSVGWEYLYLVLNRFGFNSNIIGCIRSLYDSPSARIKINGDLSDTVNLERGCRQGCPLSATFFALFIEPLAQAIREHKNISGIIIGDSEHKACLYADDVLLTLSNPKVSLPNLLSLLKEFGTYSGYKLNLQKTQIISFNYHPSIDIKKLSKFNWKNNKIKYLGIQIPKDLSRLFEENYAILTSNIKADIQRWSLLPMNMYNRIDSIKMNVLPRILYLFLALPIRIPPNQFYDWNRMMSHFIWAKQKPRIKFQTLQLQKEKGGLAVPCLEDYYKAAQLRVLIGWSDPTCEAKWKEIDQSYFDTPLQSMLGDKPLLNKHLNSQLLPPWITVPIEIWFKILKNSNTERSARCLRWPAYDSEFLPSKTDCGFVHWSQKGITGYWALSDKKVLKSYSQLSETYNLQKHDLFRYLQLRHYYDKNINFMEEEVGLVKLLVESCKGNAPKKQISKVYTCLQATRNLSTTYIRQTWEKEADILISEDDWLNICKTAMNTSSSGTWREFIWKNIVRFFISPYVKSKQCKDPDKAVCWRNCGDIKANHFHVFWSCTKITPFWSMVVKEIKSITGLDLLYDFTIVYLGNLPQELTKSEKYLLSILLAGAKKAITRKWLCEDVPSKTDWFQIITDIREMERLTFSIRLASDKCKHYWKKWDNYMKRNSAFRY